MWDLILRSYLHVLCLLTAFINRCGSHGLESVLQFIISRRRNLETHALITRVSTTTEVKGLVHMQREHCLDHVQLTAVFWGTWQAVEDGHSSVVIVSCCARRAL